MKINKEEGNNYVICRRNFLKIGFSLMASGLMGSCKEIEENSPVIWPQEENKVLSYKVNGWFGNSYETAHKFRDGFTPPEPAADEKKEVVIVGAGLAGLTAAHKLREMDIMVMEYENEAGGNARSLNWNGNYFNIGSAYFCDLSEDYGAFYNEIGIKPVAVPFPGEAWKFNNKFIYDPFENIKDFSQKIKNKITCLKQAMEEVYNGSYFPETPYEYTSETSLELDKITFAEWLKPYMSEEIKPFIDSYCYSAMGAPSDTVSAYGGLNFYASELMGDSYSSSEGNSQITRALVMGIEKAGKDRIRTSSYVYRIKQKGNDKVSVYYFHNGLARAVEAKKVIVCTPYFITSRLIDGLSEGQKEALSSAKYGSYITANLRFNKIISFKAYDTCAPDAGAFTDFISTGWLEKKSNLAKKGECQIITCFAPYEKPVMGRCHMMMETKEQVAQRIVNAFEKLIPGSVKYLEEVYLTRWGHAIIINQPYMFTKWLPAIEKKIGSIYLAHSDGQGLPSVESALCEAFRAVKEIL